MDKYRLFDKIAKCKACTFYRAEATANREGVLVKKLHKASTWEEILKSKELAVMKHAKTKFFPTMREMVKDQDRFYAIFQPLEENLECVIKSEISREDILKVSRELIKMLISFKQSQIVPREMRPSYFFVTDLRESLKLVHLETACKDISKLDLVELQDLKYLSPEQVLTSKDIDDRSSIFSVGLIIFELVTGKPLINANTKMNYMYEICRLFPGEKFGLEQSHARADIPNQTGSSALQHPNQRGMVHNPSQQASRMSHSNPNGDSFDKILSQETISPEFASLLKEMLKIDRSQRVVLEGLLDTFDLIAQNQLNFDKEKEPSEIVPQNMLNLSEQDLEGIRFQFETKPTLSTMPAISNYSKILPDEKNIEDDAVQPIIIKQSSKPLEGASLGGISILPTKESSKNSRATYKNPEFTTIKRPQLTNYAMNEANLGVQVGLNPSLFSDNDI